MSSLITAGQAGSAKGSKHRAKVEARNLFLSNIKVTNFDVDLHIINQNCNL